ncbi:hypothetical protein [Candidatus Parabeggiatoa sp. HSG14]|uniref:hypothetical protein n=1 Tax=Candidatus Parabeggiatoa sp. HSG14 TaxID=3055593 RepID=UPI0025A8A978|nr:hypothetical protein [Thiotrichales bacterium HSG14]
MLAYRKYITIENPQHIELTDLSLKVGQQVEVLILVRENTIEKNALSPDKSQQLLTPLLFVR